MQNTDIDNIDFREKDYGDPQIALTSKMRMFEREFEQGNLLKTMEYLEQDIIAVWFGIRPERLIFILDTLIRAGVDEKGSARGLYQFVSPDFEAKKFPAMRKRQRSQIPPSIIAMEEIGAMFALRTEGQVTKALELAHKSENALEHLHPLFDNRKGWDLFRIVQRGITATLAGDFQYAITSFKAAQMHPFVPALSFLTRDAYVKEALIHVLFGDSQYATVLLEQSQEVPLPGSWVENGIEVSEKIVASLIGTLSSQGSVEILESIRVREVGEIWPFYVLAFHRALDRNNEETAKKQQLDMLEAIPFPRVDGQGLNGSIFHILRAKDAIADGQFAEARQHIQKADPNFFGTREILGLLELASGNPSKALDAAHAMQSSSRTLRDTEIRRLSILAQAYLALNQQEDCVKVLEEAMKLPESLRQDEVKKFPPSVQEIGKKYVSSWPGVDEEILAEPMEMLRLIPDAPTLTPREYEVFLAYIEKFDTLIGFGSRLYISEQTAKNHLISIHRKFGVTTRDELMVRIQQA